MLVVTWQVPRDTEALSIKQAPLVLRIAWGDATQELAITLDSFSARIDNPMGVSTHKLQE
jgi:hypothetical protein